MPESVVDQIVAELRRSASTFYPHRQELKNVRVVGHTPKPEFYIYDIVIDYSDASERVAAKVYRAGKGGPQQARSLARTECSNLSRTWNLFEKKKLKGVPRPIGDFTDLGAVVAEKLVGVPLQSIIMKAALLPGYADVGTLGVAARMTGEWLRNFHKATANMPEPFNLEALIKDLQRQCDACRSEGLDDQAIRGIVQGARATLGRSKKTLASSATLNDFTPLNVVVGEKGVGICDFAKMSERGASFNDVAQFLACVEALEKYPFCNRAITTEVQEEFLKAYGLTASEEAVVRVLKMKALLAMFARGRTVKETAVRKKIMWANVMKRFIHQAAQRSLAPAA
jgi:hypothetical protein